MIRAIIKIIAKILWLYSVTLSKIPGLKEYGLKSCASNYHAAACGAYFRKEYEQALVWFHASLKHGDDYIVKESSEYLGKMYEQGLGTEKDLEKAEIFYLRAGYNGNVGTLHKVATESWYQKNEKT